MDDQAAPLFRQIAVLIEDSIVDGTLVPGDRAPSTNELAEFHSINPATARKGLNLLVDIGVLEKRRGLGMFVTHNARTNIIARRTEKFAADYVAPLIDEAVKLDLRREALHDLIEKVAESRGLYQ
ncbi:GntR family transcriptional regulator [Corynebacterium sp. sy017]|uniref:GntR family transcriptional regulator n=1 Tax=unclassified Corynebacterium TaxID=2624378 RepID=UPI0011853B14|nr:MULTISPECIES: GntR family transcriptional regulator [unclassified Corynebacterium]MBP3088207.1 GntR family transcriptional regulator [Corynebacterium sp. sy017]QDZ43397.1 GntR family transcriptional regulator [Corynebacterium sp. sy039]TSD91541.1 GntR family transcriptional regulator [Corynebacterium sp. SY003]